LRIGPDPKNHFIHHNVNVKYNLGVFFDRIFGTYMSWKDCKPEHFVFDEHSTGELSKMERKV
jgi:sterol desaturase/sphingolipid hydroxylase (fatty acid hydroxylase superfamily)